MCGPYGQPCPPRGTRDGDGCGHARMQGGALAGCCEALMGVRPQPVAAPDVGGSLHHVTAASSPSFRS